MTVQKLLLLLAAGLFTAVAAPCAASSTRGEVLLDSDTVTLGDMFDVTGEMATRAVGPAPAPGRKITYDVSAIAELARANKIDWTPKGNYERVTVTRASQAISAGMVREKVIEAITAVSPEKDLDVVLDNQTLEIHRPTKTAFSMQITDLKLDPVRHRFTGNLMIVEKDKESAADIVQVSGRAMPMTRAAMLVNAMAAGDTISEGDVEWVRMPLDKIGADAITDPKQMMGSEARRSLNAQNILRTRDLMKARMINKGGLVMMQVNTPSMRLTAQGRALADAAMGDTVRVTNTQSNRTVDAVVIGKDTVSVIPVTAATVASR